MSINDTYITRYAQNGIWYGQFTHFPDFVMQAVSTRFGGYSQNNDLNLALHTGDNTEHVIENRTKFCHAVGSSIEHIVTPQQVHGERIVYVTEEDRGRGAWNYADAISDCDALITDRPNVALFLCFADCVPVLFVDPVNHAIGLSHAGWKGTAKKIGQKTLLQMQERFGTKPKDCLVGIAPSIGACCYEVDDYVVNEFRKEYSSLDTILMPSTEEGKYHLDLWQANQLQLEEIGVPSDNIAIADICTACNAKILFSYRAEQGKTGRIAALLAIKE